MCTCAISTLFRKLSQVPPPRHHLQPSCTGTTGGYAEQCAMWLTWRPRSSAAPAASFLVKAEPDTGSSPHPKHSTAFYVRLRFPTRHAATELAHSLSIRRGNMYGEIGIRRRAARPWALLHFSTPSTCSPVCKLGSNAPLSDNRRFKLPRYRRRGCIASIDTAANCAAVPAR